MNSKIFSHIIAVIGSVCQVNTDTLNKQTILDTLPNKELLAKQLKLDFGVDIELNGTISDLVARTDNRYLLHFFGNVWKPQTEVYQWAGWYIVDEINKLNPQNVLDVGCGYNLFKDHIPGLVGIDPYNNCADYRVDILDFDAEDESYDHIIALGSINFNSKEDIELRFAKVVNLLKTKGYLWMRCNPGLDHKTGPWVEIFPWSIEIAYEFAEKFNLSLMMYKQDVDRLFFLFVKN